MPGTPAKLTVRVAKESERRAALELALLPLAPASRGPLLDSLAGRDHLLGPLDALVVASASATVEAAAWGQPSPGKAVALWLPEWRGTRPPNATDVEIEIVSSINKLCDASSVPMTQALFEVADDPRVPALAASGFRAIASLDYLGRSIDAATLREPPQNGPLSYVAYDESQRPRLKRLLQETYIDSLDCPGLDELRDLDDVLTGYLATGRHAPGYWLFVQAEGEDVGVLLLAEHPDADQAELVYMGVKPDARGKGFGAMIVEQAVVLAGQMGAEHLMVAVDRANVPARSVYDRANFAAWARRYVYVRALNGR